jgi:hypothetical protein
MRFRLLYIVFLLGGFLAKCPVAAEGTPALNSVPAVNHICLVKETGLSLVTVTNSIVDKQLEAGHLVKKKKQCKAGSLSGINILHWALPESTGFLLKGSQHTLTAPLYILYGNFRL